MTTATAVATPTTAVPSAAHVYAMHMYTERLQILISKEQRRRLEREAERRSASVASVIRDAVDERLGGVTKDDRVAAVQRLTAMEPLPFMAPDELERAIAEARDAENRFPPEGAPE